MINLNPSNTNLSGSNLSGAQTTPSGTQAATGVRPQPPGTGRILEASNLPGRLPELMVGEDVSARVVEQIDSQRVIALIKNGLFTLNLPEGTQLPSDTLKLTVASLTPNLTFTLSESAQDNSAESSAQVQLSRSAQYLTTLLTASQDPESVSTGTATTSQQAVLSKPVLLTDTPSQPAKLAEGLAHAVNKSGVFYESHVKNWAEGRLPLQQLHDEPQSRLIETLKTSVAAQSGATETSLQSDAASTGNRLSSVAPQLGQLVQRQLDSLENRTVFLQAMAWVGQPVAMTIQEEKVAERDAQEEAPDRAWSTRLALDLPTLGSVNVNLRLVNGTVQVDFLPHEEGTSQIIRDNGGRLMSGMSAAGLNLAQLTVQHGEETGA